MEKRAKEEGECGGTGRKKKNEKKQMKRKQSMRKLLLRYQEEEELELLRHLIIKYALKCCKNYPHFAPVIFISYFGSAGLTNTRWQCQGITWLFYQLKGRLFPSHMTR